jgi:hypothetical protein
MKEIKNRKRKRESKEKKGANDPAGPAQLGRPVSPPESS